jgi:hypothetical protein
VAYNSSSLGISDAGTTAQVMFREKLAMELRNGASVNHTYGYANTKNDVASKTALWGEVKGALAAANSTVDKSTATGTFRISGTALTNDLNEATLGSTSYSGSGYLNYAAGGYTYGALSGSKYATTLASEKVVKVAMSQKDLTASVTAQDKIYNGDKLATVTASSDKLASDTVTVAVTGAEFSDKNVERDINGNVITKKVTASGLSISGADAGNYTLTNATATANAKITPKDLAVSVTAQDKVYDGNISALLNSPITLEDLDTGEDLSLSVTGVFEDPNVGNNKRVVLTAVINDGINGLASNYELVTPNNLTANITGAVEPIDPPGPVVPPTPPSPNNNNTVVVAGGNNSFQLAGAEAACSADTLNQCECETATNPEGVALEGIQICYEPNTRPSSAL